MTPYAPWPSAEFQRRRPASDGNEARLRSGPPDATGRYAVTARDPSRPRVRPRRPLTAGGGGGGGSRSLARVTDRTASASHPSPSRRSSQRGGTSRYGAECGPICERSLSDPCWQFIHHRVYDASMAHDHGDDRNHGPTRRRMLALVGPSAASAFAGCSSGGSDTESLTTVVDFTRRREVTTRPRTARRALPVRLCGMPSRSLGPHSRLVGDRTRSEVYHHRSSVPPATTTGVFVSEEHRGPVGAGHRRGGGAAGMDLRTYRCNPMGEPTTRSGRR